MDQYCYNISLRIVHPTISAKEITRLLEHEPTICWAFDSPRMTPAGTPLEGVRTETYWYLNLGPQPNSGLPRSGLEIALSGVFQRLEQYKAFFSRLRNEGGRVEIYVDMQWDKPYGFELSPPLLAQASALGLSLGFEVYQVPQNQ